MTAVDAYRLGDLETAAHARLPRQVWDFLAGGSGDELTVAGNRAALERRYLVPRVLRDLSNRGMSAMVLRRSVSMPVAVAPVAFHRLFHPDGELATAQAAKAQGIPLTVSTMSSVPVEEVVSVGGSVWFQLYWLRDRNLTFDLVRRAEDAGCEAIMLTVDMPWMGRRLRDLRNRFALPDTVQAAHLALDPGSVAHRSGAGTSALACHTDLAFASVLTWTDVAELRERTRLPLILKGILAAPDAVRAVELGADAVVVSNHGGRQLDGAVPTIEVVEEICRAVAGRCPVLVDGGIRSGVDVLKALALGATAVLVGRPLMWGLAVDGADGAQQVLDLLGAELRDALGLAGCDSVEAAAQLRVIRTDAG
ncbi:MAG TPA: alpha-hydroxy acid oxidase [Pseudonocardiaceae bacterium]|nr:alpha-hydroxy acid oxidase [Pseudonocardiaceae bacterium]